MASSAPSRGGGSVTDYGSFVEIPAPGQRQCCILMKHTGAVTCGDRVLSMEQSLALVRNRFFPPDSVRFFVEALPGRGFEKYLPAAEGATASSATSSSIASTAPSAAGAGTGINMSGSTEQVTSSSVSEPRDAEPAGSRGDPDVAIPAPLDAQEERQQLKKALALSRQHQQPQQLGRDMPDGTSANTKTSSSSTASDAATAGGAAGSTVKEKTKQQSQLPVREAQGPATSERNKKAPGLSRPTTADRARAERLYASIVGKHHDGDDDDPADDGDTLSVDTSYPDPQEEQRYQDWKTNVLFERRYRGTSRDKDPRPFCDRYDFPKYHRNACIRLRHENAVTKILTAIVHDKVASEPLDESVQPRLRQDLAGVLQYLRSRLFKTCDSSSVAVSCEDTHEGVEEAVSSSDTTLTEEPAAKRRRTESPVSPDISMVAEGESVGQAAGSIDVGPHGETGTSAWLQQQPPVLEQLLVSESPVAGVLQAPAGQAAVSSTAEGGIPGCVHCNLQSMMLPASESHWMCMSSQDHSIPATGACAAPGCPRCKCVMMLQMASSSRGQHWACPSGSKQCPSLDVVHTFARTAAAAPLVPALGLEVSGPSNLSGSSLGGGREGMNDDDAHVGAHTSTHRPTPLQFLGFATVSLETTQAFINSGQHGCVLPYEDPRVDANANPGTPYPALLSLALHLSSRSTMQEGPELTRADEKRIDGKPSPVSSDGEGFEGDAREPTFLTDFEEDVAMLEAMEARAAGDDSDSEDDKVAAEQNAGQDDVTLKRERLPATSFGAPKLSTTNVMAVSGRQPAVPAAPATGAKPYEYMGERLSLPSSYQQVRDSPFRAAFPTIKAVRVDGIEVPVVAKLPGYVGGYFIPDRIRRIERFNAKVASRVWDKRVKYDVRKSFADSRLRVKGRFMPKDCNELLAQFLMMF